MTIQRTTDRLPKRRYGRRVTFRAGERETDRYDADTEQWAVETFDAIEHVGAEGAEDDLADLDYLALQQRAKDHGIAANQSREDLVAALRVAQE